jgi:hypothetical protein
MRISRFVSTCRAAMLDLIIDIFLYLMYPPVTTKQAIKITGLRAIIQKGWGGLGAGISAGPIPNVLFIEQVILKYSGAERLHN